MKSKQEISKIRKEYSLNQLSGRDVNPNPLEQFNIWFEQSISSNCLEPNAMTLATSSFEGKPSARIVLLKEYDSKGFVFYTNYESKKARHILQNPYVAIVFFWPELERQVRIEGIITKLDESLSDKYFKSRPKQSKISAWASPQSQIIPNRTYLEKLKSDYKEEFFKGTIERPPNWGGYLIEPELYEFWQGRQNRLHDRIQYTLANGEWVIERLAP